MKTITQVSLSIVLGLTLALSTAFAWVQRRYLTAYLNHPLYEHLKQLSLKLAPNKTWIGRVAKGFNCLGYCISLRGIAIAQRSLQRMQARFYWLYEQGATSQRLVNTVKNWDSMGVFGCCFKCKTTVFYNNLNPSKECFVCLSDVVYVIVINT